MSASTSGATTPSGRRRCPSGLRWHSTTHLIGRGYWVWLIPLGSGGISIGIVVDETLHPWHRGSTGSSARWSGCTSSSRSAPSYMEQERDNVEDFLALRHYAHGCARVYSADRWLLTGEAGVFTDPFYSPGSDFIAMGNEFITDLIVRDRRGEDVAARIEQHNTSYLRLFDALPAALRRAVPADGQRAGHDGQSRRGTTRATGRSPALLYFQRRIADAAFLASTRSRCCRRFFVLHARMQTFLRKWDELDTSHYRAGLYQRDVASRS